MSVRLLPTRAGRVACEETGEGPPIVLLHSAGHDRHDYDAVVPALARRFRTIAIDWPAFGESEAPDPPSSLSAARLYDVFEDVMDALALPPAFLIGNSVGAAAAVRFAGRHPARVRGLVAVDAGGFGVSGPLARAFCWIQGSPVVRRTTGVRFAASYLKLRTPLVEQILARIAESRARPATMEALAALWRSFPAEESDVTAAARDVRCPTLLVWGRRDPVTRASHDGRRAREALPHARFALLETGHVPFAEAPEAFLAALEPFLAGA